MGILDTLFKKKGESKIGEADASILAVLPEEIYESASLELQDVIAPSAQKLSLSQLIWEIKSLALFHNILSQIFNR